MKLPLEQFKGGFRGTPGARAPEIKKKSMHRYTTGKIYGIFFISAIFFSFLWSVQGVSVREIHFYGQMLLLGELISTSQQNEAQRFKNTYFGIFLN